MGERILNLAAGKLKPIDLHLPDTDSFNYFLVNIDPMYYHYDKAEDIEKEYDTWSGVTCKEFYCVEKASSFMERTKLIFDRVCVYRYLEHVPFTEVEYFIYLLSTVTKSGSIVDVIVPNYELLAGMISHENVYSRGFAAHNILVTTELLNEPSCPHASIWTKDRAKYFFELEKRFKIINIQENYPFDGRDIYLRIIAGRV